MDERIKEAADNLTEEERMKETAADNLRNTASARSNNNESNNALPSDEQVKQQYENLKKAITDTLQKINNGEPLVYPEDFKEAFRKCGNVLSFEGKLYTVERVNGEIVVKNISDDLKNQVDEAQQKYNRQKIDDAERSARNLQNTIHDGQINGGARRGGRRTRKSNKLSSNSLKKMSKSKLRKIIKSMKKK